MLVHLLLFITFFSWCLGGLNGFTILGIVGHFTHAYYYVGLDLGVILSLEDPRSIHGHVCEARILIPQNYECIGG